MAILRVKNQSGEWQEIPQLQGPTGPTGPMPDTPRYSFGNASFSSSQITVTPFKCQTIIPNDGTSALSVAMGAAESGSVREAILVIDCRTNSSDVTLSWGTAFSPRFSEDADLKCASGEENVYWIREYKEDCFVVERWAR